MYPMRPRWLFMQRASPDGPVDGHASREPRSTRRPRASFRRRPRKAWDAGAASSARGAKTLAPHDRRPAGQRGRRALDVGEAGSRLRFSAGSRQASWSPRTRNCAPRACPVRSRGTSEVLPSWCFRRARPRTHLPEDNEEAIALLTKIKGIGRWSAEIYLLFAEGRRDVFPAGDLAVLIEIGRLMGFARQAEREAASRNAESLEAVSRCRGSARMAQLQLRRCCRRVRYERTA